MYAFPRLRGSLRSGAGTESAQVTAQVLRGIEQGYDLVVANFANGDVLGHTQIARPRSSAPLVDAWLGQVVDAALASGM